MIQDSLTTISVTRKEAAMFCQFIQNFPLKKYNHIYLQLKAASVCVERQQFDELNLLLNEVIVNCNELLNALTVVNGRTGGTMTNVLCEVRMCAVLIIRNISKSDEDLDYERSIGLSKIRRLHLSETSTDWESYFLQFDVM
jgi:hypothetical protein